MLRRGAMVIMIRVSLLFDMICHATYAQALTPCYRLPSLIFFAPRYNIYVQYIACHRHQGCLSFAFLFTPPFSLRRLLYVAAAAYDATLMLRYATLRYYAMPMATLFRCCYGLRR